MRFYYLFALLTVNFLFQSEKWDMEASNLTPKKSTLWEVRRPFLCLDAMKIELSLMSARCFVNSCLTGLTELCHGRVAKNAMLHWVRKTTTWTFWVNRRLNKMPQVYVSIKYYDVEMSSCHFEGEWVVHVWSQSFVDVCRERLLSWLLIQVFSFVCVNICLMNLLMLFFNVSFIG